MGDDEVRRRRRIDGEVTYLIVGECCSLRIVGWSLVVMCL